MATNSYVWKVTQTPTTAGTATSGTAVGMPTTTGATIECRFTFGSGGGATAAKVYVQNSLDGTNFYDVACATFGTVDATKLGTLYVTAGTAWATPTDGSLTDDTLLSPAALGADWRVKTITTQVYASTTIAVSVSPKP